MYFWAALLLLTKVASLPRYSAVPEDEVVELAGRGSTSLASPLYARADSCETLTNDIITIGTSSEMAVYASTGGFTALYVCNRVNGQDCRTLALAIASAIASIFLILVRSGAISARDGSGESLLDFLNRELAADGATFDSITDATSHALLQYDAGAPTPVEVVSVQGLSQLNTTVNFDFYDFGNGEGHIYLPHDVYEKRSNIDPASRFAKRQTAPGFKVSYTTRLPSELTRAHQIEMAQDLSTFWADSANCCNIHDLIGFVKTEHDANFYWRIIPETVNFGLNYETVDSCGQMAQYL